MKKLPNHYSCSALSVFLSFLSLIGSEATKKSDIFFSKISPNILCSATFIAALNGYVRDNAKKNENFLLSIQRGSFRDSLEISVKKSQKSLVVILSRRRKFASSSFPWLWRGFHFSLLPFDVLATLPREEILFIKDLNKADADVSEHIFPDASETNEELDENLYIKILFYSATFFSLKNISILWNKLYGEKSCSYSHFTTTRWLLTSSPRYRFSISHSVHSRHPSVLLVGLRGFENQRKLLVFFLCCCCRTQAIA